MKYQSKSTTAYIFRNFPRMALFALPAAVAAGFFLNTSSEMALASSETTADNLLGQIFGAISIMRFGKNWWCALLALLLCVLSESFLFVKVENHMRTGGMPLFPVKRAFTVFPIVALFVLCMTVFVEALNLVIVGVGFLIRNMSLFVVFVVCLGLEYIVRIISVVVLGALLCAFPIMYLEHYSFNNALSYSVRLMLEKRSVLYACALFYILIRLLLSTACYFFESEALAVISFSVFYLFVLLLVPSMTFKLYYDTVGGERRDIGVMMFK